jgi:glycosyltransferase involved in cell wall biosynthesis
MFDNRKVTVVMPAFNAASALQMICAELMAQSLVNSMILIGDASRDRTIAPSR